MNSLKLVARTFNFGGTQMLATAMIEGKGLRLGVTIAMDDYCLHWLILVLFL